MNAYLNSIVAIVFPPNAARHGFLRDLAGLATVHRQELESDPAEERILTPAFWDMSHHAAFLDDHAILLSNECIFMGLDPPSVC